MFGSLLHSKLAAAGLAGVLALGVVGGGIAMAEAGPGGTPSATSNGGATTPAHPRLRAELGLLKDTVAKSGLDRSVFVQGFKDGKTINDILGTNADSVKAQVQADAQAKIADLLSKGTITSDQADKLNQKLPGALDKLYSSTPKGHPGARIAAVGKAALQTVADTLQMDVATLKADLKGGQTIAQVAGPKTTDVISALDARADAAVDKLVSDGKVKPDRADAIKTRLHDRITNIVNNGRPHKTK